MSLFKYKAIPLAAGAPSEQDARHPDSGVVEGELSCESAAEARAQLRRVGLQAFEVKAQKAAPKLATSALGETLQKYLRGRRVSDRAEMFDGLATMLESGLPMLESLDALLKVKRQAKASNVLRRMRERLRGGNSLSLSMKEEPTWFDPVEVAMVSSGELGGTLPVVLRALADRHARSDELLSRLMGALTYPTAVLGLGLLVVVFLATKTLPELVRMLTDAKIEPPALTVHVMAIGQFIAAFGYLLPLVAIVLIGFFLVFKKREAWKRLAAAKVFERFLPEFVRRMRLALFSRGVCDLLACGVPLVEAVKVIEPTTASPSLRASLKEARDLLERGVPLGDAFQSETWFDPEFLRLLEVGQATGELPTLLSRLASRYERSASRAIDRLSRILEPLAILCLAVLVGTVAMAALLPLLKLQEIL